MDNQKRIAWLQQIQHNIDTHGHHITSVQGGNVPRFTYTIGLTPTLGAELILAGGYDFILSEVPEIINTLAQRITLPLAEQGSISLGDALGGFSFRPVHESWATQMLLGVYDVYQIDHVTAFQVVPDDAHFTLDIPDLSQPWDKTANPLWRCLDDAEEPHWPKNLLGITHLDVLRGHKVTYATRWENDEWELFTVAPNEVVKSDIRLVSLALLIALDPSLEEVVSLAESEALWRDLEELVWYAWE